MINNEQIGLRIKASREQKGLTQKELGQAIGRTESAIRKYEKGLIEVPISILVKISLVLLTDLAFLIGIKEVNLKNSVGEIEGIIYRYIPNIVNSIKSICTANKGFNIKQPDKFYTELAIKIANEISKIDFYDVYDLFDSEIYQNLDKYFINSNAKEIFNEIEIDINNINIPKEMKIVIEEAYSDDDFYGIDLRKIIFNAVNDNELTEIIVSSIYSSEVMDNIITNISKLIEMNYFNIIIKEITHEYFEKLNVIGKGKVLDYIKDLLSNDNYKEGE